MQHFKARGARILVGIAFGLLVVAPKYALSDINYSGGVASYFCQQNQTCNPEYDVDAHHVEFNGAFSCNFQEPQAVGIYDPKSVICSSPNSAITCSVSDQGDRKSCQCNQKTQKTEYKVKVKIECGPPPPPPNK